mmetsp:Transcript_86258/g.152711  ORF Transcript_86258/g.152711 Transcript_86258/m.152711 type:complete len:181 (-) Transcript_86258:84-626(-)|eukprot:CAMPEP_0197663134 /NCGR_PEP_ID=MMETSP1338-20131121/56239_1 /TAXON_ID=43686 ORGANISM="Pelagodinium beii, Strain RCC1491" /NCGR_SAMPLE_ID=MMETSP1338 /ASSEMBLY_ACC=CAM_ASM_000754 /LENGTH=180 /DNA_ID=CAMNT_0043241355 /DNA_START=56 /DNA_END=598 /DNA_ORIENTATION=+
MAQQALQQHKRLMAREARRILATKIVAEQARPWWEVSSNIMAGEGQRLSKSFSLEAVDVNCHRILGASPGASSAELKAAFLAKAQQHHPAVSAPLDEGSNFVLARACYEFIASPQQREERRLASTARSEVPLRAVKNQTWSGRWAGMGMARRLMASLAARAVPEHSIDVLACPTRSLSLL